MDSGPARTPGRNHREIFGHWQGEGMNWQGLHVLVTGGAGQIGSNLVARLVESGARVRVVDNLWRGKKYNLTERGQPLIDMEKDFMQLDLRDYANCLSSVENQDIIFHLADVVAGINFVFDNEFFVYNSNGLIDSNVSRAALESGAPKYVYVGSACSYPAEKQSVLNPPPFKEEDAYPASPESAYGWSKLMGEYGCELLRQDSRVEVGVLRLHNVYGPRCEMSPEKSQVIPSLIRKAINYPREDFVVWGSGNQRRAFVYVDDAVAALMAVAEHGMNRGVIQIGPDVSTSIRSIAELVVGISGKAIEISYDTAKPEGDVDRCADWSKAKEILGWAPATAIEDGLRQTYAWCDQFPAQGQS